MNTYKLISIAAALIVLAGSCKKEEDPTTTTNNNNNNTNIPCNGNGSANWVPLKVGNEWHFTSPFDSSYYKMSGTVVYGGKTYYKVDRKEMGVVVAPVYFRQESNGDLVEYGTSGDYTVVPANPVKGQEWSIPWMTGSGKRIVMAVDTSVASSICVHSKVVKIRDEMQDGTLINEYYYKKGLGLVGEGFFPLKAVTLK